MQYPRAHAYVVSKADYIAVETEQDCGAVAERNGCKLNPAEAATEQLRHREFQLIRFRI